MAVSSTEWLGRFRLECEIGRGSFSTVWRAHDSTLRRDVAIKIPRLELNNTTKESFLKEARRVAQLNHEGIVRVLEANIDESSTTPYMVLELVEGVTLREWCSFVDLTVYDQAKIVVKVARAVQHAHSAGIIHRDLKPANVLMSLTGKVQVADFGLARARGIDVSTETSTIGTIAYMSPEQAKLLPDLVSAASDVYSMGVILFEMLSGSNPIDATSPAEHLAKLATGDRKRLRSLRVDLPEDLVLICQKALEHLPSARFNSAGELADELERFVLGVPILSKRPSISESIWLIAKRHWQLVVLFLAGILFISAGVVAGLKTLERIRKDRVARRLVAMSNLLNCKPSGVPAALRDIAPFSPDAVAELEELSESEDPATRLRPLMALAAMGRTKVDQLIIAIQDCPIDEVENLINALLHKKTVSINSLRKMLEIEMSRAEYDADWLTATRLAIILAHVGDTEGVIQLSQLDPDPRARTQLLQEWPKFHGQLEDLLSWTKSEQPSNLFSILVEVLGKWERTSKDKNAKINQAITHIYETNGSSAVHSASSWALRHRGCNVPEIRPDRIAERDWFELESGLVMVRLNQAIDSPPLSTLSVSATEITNRQFCYFRPEHLDALQHKFNGDHSHDDAVRDIDAKSMFEYCNFLSDQISLVHCYSIVGDSDPISPEFILDFGANGFRLPTVDEWKIANLAGSRLGYFYGDDDDQLTRFANVSGQPRTAPTMMFPSNAIGLFDTLGNVAEGCHPNRQSGVIKHLRFLGGSMMPIPGDHRGTITIQKNLNQNSVTLGFRVVCSR